MGIQLRLILDLFAVCELHLGGLVALAADPLVVRLWGGVVPGIEPPYRGARRFDAPALDASSKL